jgi:hypothetical protein
MSSPDDYEVMRELRGISDRDIERLLVGEVLGDADLDDVAIHLRNLRAVSAQAPGDAVATRHVAAVVAAARTRAHGAAPRGAAPPFTPAGALLRRVKTAAAGVAAAAVGLTGATTGLAYTGVDLPGRAAERAVEAVLSVELPNQDVAENRASAGVVADRVRAIIAAWTEEARGCEFGQAVSGAARGENEVRPAEDPCTNDGNTTAKGSKATGEEKSAAGKARAEEARARAEERAASGRARGAEGRSNGPEKSTAGRATAEEKSSAGRATGNENSTGGQSTADEKSSAGQSNAEENPGGDHPTGEDRSSEGRATAEQKSSAAQDRAGGSQ